MEQKNTIPILIKALDVLEYIGSHHGTVSLPELQRNLNISQASCYRIITTLMARNWLKKVGKNHYDIANGVNIIAQKTQFQLERYKTIQPTLNYIANTIGYSAKVSVLDGNQFVNVCSARVLSGEMLIFSEPGFRADLSSPASVGTIFLSETSPQKQEELIAPEQLEAFQKQLDFYKKNGFSFQYGSSDNDARYHFDTLSFPVKLKNKLLGVLSFINFPNSLAKEFETINKEVKPFLTIIAKLL